MVIDCGAHVGLFTRYSLNRGAARVVAIEPDAASIACFEVNFPNDTARGKVTLIKGAVGDRSGAMVLNLDSNSAKHTTAELPSEELEGTEKVRACKLDEIVKQLGLSRVYFIKMDIEGAERQALRGAAWTLETYRPRLAICVYHTLDEPPVVCATVDSISPGYRRWTKDLELRPDYIAPKVIFFR